MSGYVRQKSAEIVLGAVARASDIAAELDQIQTAFNSSSGHVHSGASGEGAPITVVGPAQDVIVSTTLVRPKTDDTVDLGSATYEFKDGYFDGVLYADTINLDGTNITSTAAELNILDGVTATAAEINILDGVTSTAVELNILDGATLTTTELNYVDGVTSAIQTQLDSKAPVATQIIAGDGLTGGGTLAANRTLNIGAGDGISVGVDTIAVNGTVVRTSGSQTIAGAKTFSDTISTTSMNQGDLNTGSNLKGGSVYDTDVNGGSIQLQCLNATSDSRNMVRHYKGTSTVYQVLASGDVRNANNSYGAISDENLKRDIEPSGPQLDDVMSLEVVKYRLITAENDSPKHIGLIAQQVGLIKPGLVSEDEAGILGVKYSVLVPILIKALQELSEKVDSLEARIEALEQ